MTIPEPLASYQAPVDLLQDKVVLVTGAGDGIGRAVTRCYARHGATVVALDRKSRKLETLYDEIMAQGWTEPALAVHDLGDLDTQRSEQIAAGIGHDFGRLDGLLHNAGLLRSLAPLPSYDQGQWLDLLQVNLTAPFLLSRALMPLLRLAPAASVIFTSADVGRRGRAYWGAYAAAYGAIERLAQVMADELEANTSVRVNTLDPGPVRTALRNRAYPGEDSDGLPHPEEITAAYLYLMGDDSADLSGQALCAQDPPSD